MPPRVLIASHLFPSVQRPTSAPWLAEQVSALVGAGIGVDVLCCSPFEKDVDVTLSAGGKAVPVHYRSTSAGPMNGTRAGILLSAARYTGQARRYLDDGADRYDVLHAHFGFPDGFVMVREGLRRSVPTVVTLHGSDVTSVLARPGALSRVVSRRIASATNLVCVSRALERAAQEVLPEEASTLVIHNGYDARLFRPDGEKRDLGYLFVGALRPVKGVDALVDTYLENRDLWDLPLTIAGSGPLEGALKRRSAGAEDGANVRFLGELPREKVADAMRRASALILPSRQEGYGVVVAEALACGTPVVASRVGALDEIMADPRTGVLIEADDRHGLSEAMRAVRRWPYPAGEVASASAARPWHEQAEEIARLYGEILRERYDRAATDG
ncbi:MAG: glycosyltransferase [Coriobacteriia bacterium]|nr:glycosyltransferase [Coriobacteriia bacterium]